MNNYLALTSSQLKNAPWNEIELEPKKIKVTVSITLSKTVEVEVDDYNVIDDINEFGHIHVDDFSECNLEQAVRDQITLPNEAYNELHHAVFLTEDYKAKKSMEDLKDWTVDDFEVILDD